MNDKPAKPTIEMVTHKQLCTELKVDPREARERLRLAVRDAKKNPELAKAHKPGPILHALPPNSHQVRKFRELYALREGGSRPTVH